MLVVIRRLKGLLSCLAVYAGLSFSIGVQADIYVADGQRGTSGSLYRVDVNTGELTSVAPLAQPVHAMTFGADGITLYAVTNTWRNVGGNGKLVSIDINTGEFTDIISSNPDRFVGIAYHQADGFLYAVDNDRDLYRINPETGEFTFLFDISGSRRGLASDGVTLFHSTGSQLRSVSTTVDSQTTIGSFNTRFDRAIKDITFDPVLDTLLGIDRSGGIYSINKTTGAASLLSDTGGGRIAIAAQGFKDDDLDGMNDYWEIFYGLNPLFDDSALDLDGDGVSNLQEYQLLSNPTIPDTDSDGLADAVEFDLGTSLSQTDTDEDGKSDYFEVLLGSNPLADESILAIGTTEGTSDNAAVATDSDGNVHVVYNNRIGESFAKIYYTMLSSDGEVLIGSTLISDDDSRNSKMPDVTVSNGKVYLVWHSRLGGEEESTPEVEFAVLDPSRVPHNGSVANPDALKTVGPLYISDIDGRKSNHARIAPGTNGKLHVVYEDGSILDVIHYLKLDTNGSIIFDTTLTSSGNLRRAFPDLAVDSQNKVHITWRDSEGEGGNIYYGLINGNNGEILIDSTYISRGGSSTVNVDANNIASIVFGVFTSSLDMIRINPALDDLDGSAADLPTITSVPQFSLISLGGDRLDKIIKAKAEAKVLSKDVDFGSRLHHPFARMDENGNLLVSYLSDGSTGNGNVKYFTVSSDNKVSFGGDLVNNVANRFEQLKISRDTKALAIASGNNIHLYKNLQNSFVSGASIVGGTFEIVGLAEDDLPEGAKSDAPNAHEDNFFSMLIKTPQGETVTVTLPTTLRLDEDSTFEVWTEATGWTEFDVPNLAEVTVELTDGGPGDADGVANGFIVINALALVSSNGGSFIQEFLDAGNSLFEDENKNGTEGGSVGGIMLMLLLANGLFRVTRHKKTLH